MQKIRQVAFEVFLIIGERIALVIILILASALLLIQRPQQAFSEENSYESFRDSFEQNIEEIPGKKESILIVSSTPTPTIRLETIFEPVPTTSMPSITPTSTPQPKIVTPTATVIPTATPTIVILPTATLIPTPMVLAIDPNNDVVWDQLAKCESGGNWSIDTGNGYFGGLQFSQGSWESVGGTGNPAAASREEQIMRGKMLHDRRGGFSAWGLCAKNLGLN